MNTVLSREFGLPSIHSTRISEIEDIYYTYVSSPNNTRKHHLNAVKQVKYPLFPTEVLKDKSNDTLKTLGSFLFSEGGRFISNTTLIPDKYLPSVLKIFANFVSYDRNELKINGRFDLSNYETFPSMFINIAYHSRIDEGYRLLERAARHATDTKTPSIFNESAELFRLEDNEEDTDNIGIILQSTIEASMRHASYQASASITYKGDLAASCCTCKAGCARMSDRGVCVHILPVLMQVTILLINGLAQNILVELSHRWNIDLEESIESAGKMDLVKKSILTLRSADGCDCVHHDITKTNVTDLLKEYSVGTEKEKIVHFLPSNDELIPLRKMKIVSTRKVLQTTLKIDCSNSRTRKTVSNKENDRKNFINEIEESIKMGKMIL